MESLYIQTGYYIAATVLYGLTCIAASILAIYTARVIHPRNDPARKGVFWLKLSAGLFSLACLFLTLSFALQVVSYSGKAPTFQPWFAFTLLGQLGISFVDAVIPIVVLRTGSGILLVHTGSQPRSMRALTITVYTIFCAIAILSFVQMGFFIKQYFDIFGDSAEYAVTTTLRAVAFVISLFVISRSVQVAVKCHPEPRVSKGPALLVSASILWLTRALCQAITIATAERYSSGAAHYPVYEIIIEYVFAVLPVLVLLSLLYILYAKNENGLWSISQPPINQGSQRPASEVSDVVDDSHPEKPHVDLEAQAYRNLQMQHQVQFHVGM